MCKQDQGRILLSNHNLFSYQHQNFHQILIYFTHAEKVQMMLKLFSVTRNQKEHPSFYIRISIWKSKFFNLNPWRWSYMGGAINTLLLLSSVGMQAYVVFRIVNYKKFLLFYLLSSSLLTIWLDVSKKYSEHINSVVNYHKNLSHNHSRGIFRHYTVLFELLVRWGLSESICYWKNSEVWFLVWEW